MTSKLEYLQRYMGASSETADKPSKKLRKKRKPTADASGTRIVDVDHDWTTDKPTSRTSHSEWEATTGRDDDAFDDEEDAPVVVAGGDVDPAELATATNARALAAQLRGKSTPSTRVNTDADEDLSPPRRAGRSSLNRARAEEKQDEDASPPRRRGAKDAEDDDDASPPRRQKVPARKGSDGEDASPPRRRRPTRDSDDDEISPPRRRGRIPSDDDASPPRRDRANKKADDTDSDASPPRRREERAATAAKPSRDRHSRSPRRERSPARRGRRSSRSRSPARRGRSRSPRRGSSRRPSHSRSRSRGRSRRSRSPLRRSSRSRDRQRSSYRANRRSPSPAERRRTRRSPSANSPGARRRPRRGSSRGRSASSSATPPRRSTTRRKESDEKSSGTSQGIGNDRVAPVSKDPQEGSRDVEPAKDEYKPRAGLFTAAEFADDLKAKAAHNDMLKGASAEDMGHKAETVYRDKKGRKLDMLNELVRQQEILDGKREREAKEEYEWGTGRVQKQEKLSQKELMEKIKSAPFARRADDAELEAMRRERVRAFDPMNSKVFQDDSLLADTGDKRSKKHKKSKKSKSKGTSDKPKYAGPPAPPNRFGVQPGYRWDGVVRGTGWEEKIMLRANTQNAQSDEAYRYAVADM